jgi:indole-3-glycerol phosphate synthase
VNILDKILNHKRTEIEKIPEKNFESSNFKRLSLKKALKGDKISIIAEIKFASPSEGVILKKGEHIQIAKDYENAGAAAISVLTDRRFFNGDIRFLEDIKNVVNIPVIQKDFIISKKQILQGMSHGSDAFLLITEALNYNDLNDLYKLGLNEKLESLVEIHDRKNLLTVNELNPSIVGVNCRNLKKMELDFSRFERFYTKLPKNSLKVAESGFKSSKRIKIVEQLGYDAILMGTSLMKSKNPGKKLEKIINEL